MSHSALLAATSGRPGTVLADWETINSNLGSWNGITCPAVYYNGKTYVGYVNPSAEIRAFSYDHATGAVVTSPAIIAAGSGGIDANSHSGPSILVRQSDHRLVIAASPHAAKHMFIAVSTNAGDVSNWGAATDIQSTLGGVGYTYPNLVQLSGESGKIYLFYRDLLSGFGATNMSYSTSTDGGATWAAGTNLYSNSNVMYWNIDTNSTDRIDFATSDGEISHAVDASLYHFYYTGGHFYKSDGTQITSSLPLAASDFTKIYDTSNGGVSTGIRITRNGPAVAFETAPVEGYNNASDRNKYARYSVGTWTTHDIVDTGATPSSGGGQAVTNSNTSNLLIGRKVSGVTQMFRYLTADSGATWTVTQLTHDTSNANLDVVPVRDETGTAIGFVWLYSSDGNMGEFRAWPGH